MLRLRRQDIPFKAVNRMTSGATGESVQPEAVNDHPWWSVCLTLEHHDRERAWQRLKTWRLEGVPVETEATILQALGKAGGVSDPGADDSGITDLGFIRLECFGTSLLDWHAHAWLQRCALPKGFELTDATDGPRIGLNLESLAYWFSRPTELESLCGFAALWDPDPDRVAVLRAFGIPARQLHAGLPCNGWLDRIRDPQDAMLTLGMPHPRSLAGEESILVLGQTQASADEPYQPGIYEWPDFESAQILDPDNARLLAHWLEHCSRLGIQIVRLKPTVQELNQKGFLSLTLGNQPRQLVSQYFHGELHLSVLKDELNWRRNGRPTPPPVADRSSEPIIVWETHNSGPSQAGVCISLYNYETRITTALESVNAQSQKGLELIVVDDASTDHSLETAQKWLQQNHHGFSHVALIRHDTNAGLAAARNTAFEMATSPWCFVLDADNHLHPQAVEQCLKIAVDSAPEIAVIHPLINQRNEGPSKQDSRNLISGRSWQKSHFRHENHIDAMAMIRRSAWRAVGGYSHIEDGWEDYDFWCKLVDHGFQGVLCPQVLATYISHDQSMIHRRTNRQVRRISRMLQARHPWLDLPMARLDA